MNTRFKLVAALGLALATAFAGVASAQTTDPTAPAVTKTDAGIPAPSTPAKVPMTTSPTMKKTALKGHRTHVTHRATKHAKIAHRISTHAKVAHKTSLTASTKTAKSGLLRKHVARAKGFFAKHAMNRTAKATVIR